MFALLVAALLVSSQGTAVGSKVKELQKERIATLKEMVDLTFKLAKGARVELSDALEDRLTLLKAELEIAENNTARITLYKEALESIKEYEEIARDLMERARGTTLNSLKIKAARLELELALEKAKARKE